MSNPAMDKGEDDNTLIGDADSVPTSPYRKVEKNSFIGTATSPCQKADRKTDQQQCGLTEASRGPKAALDLFVDQPGEFGVICNALAAAHLRMADSHQHTMTLLRTQGTELVLANGAVEAVQVDRRRRVDYLTSLVCRMEGTIFEEMRLRKMAEVKVERLEKKVDQKTREFENERLALASETFARREENIAAGTLERKAEALTEENLKLRRKAEALTGENLRLRRIVQDLKERNRKLSSDLFPLQVLAGMRDRGVVDVEEWMDFIRAITLMETIVKALQNNWSYKDWLWRSKGATRQCLIDLRAMICSLY